MENNFTKISNVATLMEAEQLISLLRANSILAEKRETGSGSYMNIISGMSLGGYDIYVADKDKEKAKVLIGGQCEEPDNENQDVPVSKRKIAVRIYAVVVLLMLLFAIVMMFMDL